MESKTPYSYTYSYTQISSDTADGRKVSRLEAIRVYEYVYEYGIR